MANAMRFAWMDEFRRRVVEPALSARIMDINIALYADERDLAVCVTYADYDRLSPTCSELRVYFPGSAIPWLLRENLPWLEK